MNILLRIVLLINTLLFIQNFSIAQNTWNRILGGPRSDRGWSCFQTLTGDFIIVGKKTVLNINNNQPIEQTLLLKLNSEGEIIWQKVLGDSLYENFSYSAVEDPFGNLFIASNWGLPRLIKTDNNGNFLWYREYNSHILEFGGIKFIDNNRNVLIYSANETRLFGVTTGLQKIDSSGNLLWSKNYQDTIVYSNQYGGFLPSSDSYYLVGSRSDIQSRVGFIIKTDTSGNVLWKKFTDDRVQLYSLAQNSSYSFIATGTKLNDGNAFCLKLDTTGNTIWEKTYVSDSVGNCWSIVKTLDSKFAIAASGYTGNGRLFVIDSLGSALINKTHYYGSSETLVSYDAVNICVDSGFILTGVIELNNNGFGDCLVVKTDKLGNTIPIGIINQTEIINDFILSVNTYPNPFNAQTIIELHMEKPALVTLKLFNILGQEIATVFNGEMNLGTNKIPIYPEEFNLTSGIYFISIKAYIPGSESKLFYHKISYIK